MQCLTPTKLYVNLVQHLLKLQNENIHGVAHITGGGFHNIPRMNEELGYDITHLPSDEFRPPFMNEIVKRSGMNKAKSYETFNMGIGLVIACGDADKLMSELKHLGEKCMMLGKVSGDFKELRLA
jgi:phosphoribosylformylglycinamidine cyclo-ligase